MGAFGSFKKLVIDFLIEKWGANLIAWIAIASVFYIYALLGCFLYDDFSMPKSIPSIARFADHKLFFAFIVAYMVVIGAVRTIFDFIYKNPVDIFEKIQDEGLNITLTLGSISMIAAFMDWSGSGVWLGLGYWGFSLLWFSKLRRKNLTLTSHKQP